MLAMCSALRRASCTVTSILWGITCAARTPCAHCVHTAQRVGTNYGEKVIPWFPGYSMLTYRPHSQAEMTVGGTLSPVDRM